VPTYIPLPSTLYVRVRTLDSKMAGEHWHHLQLKDNVFGDEYEDVDCWLCKKPVLGSRGYECTQWICFGFFLHESCPVPTDKTSHDLRSRHHLISMKEVDNNGENKVVCSLCEEPVSGLLGNNGPTIYKCSIPNCSFLLLHEPCAQLPYIITTHPLHFPNHNLYLEWATESNSREFCCHACCEVLNKGLFYGCVKCDDYNLHFRCASRWLNISTADNCNRHAFIPIRDPFEFTCKACGVKDSHFACLCSNCRLLIHINCGKFLGTIKIRGHDHSLTCTFSLTSKGKKHEYEVCNKEVDTNHAAYCCDDHKCDYIAHLRCAYWLRKDVSETSTTVFDEYATHLVEGSDLKEDEKIGTQEIRQHPSHPQHKLILKNEELQDVKLCKGCMQFITLLPFYGCEEECSFSLHIRCAKLPQEVRRLKHHQHPLTLHNNVQLLDFCWTCNRYWSGFSYICVKDSCSYARFDAQCILIPEVFKHKGHQHHLFLGSTYQPECHACGKLPGGDQTFDCTTCGFCLCIRCATLPLVARYRYDTHLLHLTYAAAKDNSEEYYCEICEEVMKENLWFYYCKDCDVATHPRCILGETWLE
jgi:hypothetical protein